MRTTKKRHKRIAKTTLLDKARQQHRLTPSRPPVSSSSITYTTTTMRHKRAKQNRRTLQYFERIGGGGGGHHQFFRPPYHILIDGPFLTAMIKLKLIDVLHDRLATVLSHTHDVRIYVLSSTVRELEKVGMVHPTNATIQTALQWCHQSTSNGGGDGRNGNGNCTVLSNDDDVPTSTGAGGSGATAHGGDDGVATKGKGTGKHAAEDAAVVVRPETVESLSDAARKLFDYVAAHPRYFVASQDEELLSSLRQNRHLPVPIIRLSRSVLLLERPNFHHQHHHHQDKTTTTTTGNGSGGSTSTATPVKGSALTASERELVDMIKRQERDQRLSSASKSHHHGSGRTLSKKAKGPNPLSCKPSTKNNKRKAVEASSEPTMTSNNAGHNNKKRSRRKKSTTTSSSSSAAIITTDGAKTK
jgi:rRNA-processing protein FCF1